MTRRILKNKPLVEAIFELRWALQETEEGARIDPDYQLLIGRMYDRMQNDYPFHERLPAATIPDEIAGYIVQHRFRRAEGEWPLMQIGPGIITVNDTENYTWEDFEKRITRVVSTLFDTHSRRESLRIAKLLLRYIDAVGFNFEKNDVRKFLKEKLKFDMKLDDGLFKDTGVGTLMSGLDSTFAFPSTRPSGSVHLRFARGKRRDADALVWETMVDVSGEEAPQTANEVDQWVQEAHDLSHDWFYKMIEGDLLKRFE